MENGGERRAGAAVAAEAVTGNMADRKEANKKAGKSLLSLFL